MRHQVKQALEHTAAQQDREVQHALAVLSKHFTSFAFIGSNNGAAQTKYVSAPELLARRHIESELDWVLENMAGWEQDAAKELNTVEDVKTEVSLLTLAAEKALSKEDFKSLMKTSQARAKAVVASLSKAELAAFVSEENAKAARKGTR